MSELTVIALVWNPFSAKTPFGWYGVTDAPMANGKFGLRFDGTGLGDFDSVPAAKAAAQADYERRILSALTASASEPEPVADEAIVEAAAIQALEWEDLKAIVRNAKAGTAGVTTQRDWKVATDAARCALSHASWLANPVTTPDGAVTDGWRSIESAPKDRLIDIWLKSGTRWCDCYYDRICDEWRTSRPGGRLVYVKASGVLFWREPPAAPLAAKPEGE